MRVFLGIFLAAALLLQAGGGAAAAAADDKAKVLEGKGEGEEMDQMKSKGAFSYLALVNKLHPLPEGWEEGLELVTATNSLGDEFEVEKRAYEAFLALQEDLSSREGVLIQLDGAYRSVAKQQEILESFTQEYGSAYAAKIVARPGYSEHHTGLALDLYLQVDGQDVYLNEEMVKYPQIWEKIHGRLSDHGFILRYLKEKEHLTGYAYEPWHIRYLGDPALAREIMEKGLTLEEYLGSVKSAQVSIDVCQSKLYTQEELEEAMVQIKCEFATFEGCELHRIRYLGDECNSEENLQWMKEIRPEEEFTQVAAFLSDFHSPLEAYGAWKPDEEYTDFSWWLARAKEGDWTLVTWGY